MKVVAKTKDGKDSPFLADIAIPKAVPNSVVLKVLASPINPSDEYFAKGLFGISSYEPFVCGFEGAGVITEVGEGVPHDVIGKKVSVSTGDSPISVGMWSQYARVPYDGCFFLGEHDNCEEYCELFVNPFTLLGFVRIVKEMKLKALVHTAALSSLGKSLLRVCAAEGISVIGVIRKKEDLKKLLDLGAVCALDLNDPNFVTQLHDAAAKFGARVAFDAITGKVTADLVKAMPENSVIYRYGMLSGEKAGTDSAQEEAKAKGIQIRWFTVTNDKVMADPEERKKAAEFIKTDIKNGGKFFKINVAAKFPLTEFKTAIEAHSKVATQGKVIFVPNP